MATRSRKRTAKARDGLTVGIIGVDKLLRNLAALTEDISGGLETVAQAGADVLQERIEGNVGGSIRDAMMTSTTEKSSKSVTIAVGPSRAAWYANFVEYGTTAHTAAARDGDALKIYGDAITYRRTVSPAGAPAQPFMRPGFDAGKRQASEAIRLALKAIVDP